MSQQPAIRFPALVRGIAAAVVGSLALIGCGGGSTSAPAQSKYAFGRISGFGSVVVKGVHYDETAAAIADDDGAAASGTDLKLGMMVAVDASAPSGSTGTTESAQDITMVSLMRGPVESVAADSLVVLGQTVMVNGSTVFDDSLAGGLAAVKAGAVVRIFGLLDGSGYTATRIEVSNATTYALLGAVTALDAMRKTMNIGMALIDVSGVTLPSGTAVGSLVRVKLQTTQANGAWVAISVKSGAQHPHDSNEAEVEGTITDLMSSASFSVNGMPVDASKAAFPDGTAGVILGAHVEVEGSIVNGVLVATKVSLETDSEIASQAFDVTGAIASIDTMGMTFVVHDVTVSYAGTVTYVGGAAMDLKVGAKVEVKGTLASDGKTLNATQITFEH